MEKRTGRHTGYVREFNIFLTGREKIETWQKGFRDYDLELPRTDGRC